jgi:hypothetical protein
MPIVVTILLAGLATRWGFLEWFFAGMLSILVLAVGGFALFVGVQLFRNPARRTRTKY